MSVGADEGGNEYLAREDSERRGGGVREGLWQTREPVSSTSVCWVTCVFVQL